MIPKHEVEALAENLCPAIVEFYESERGQAEFKAWQAQQSKPKADEFNNIKTTNEG